MSCKPSDEHLFVVGDNFIRLALFVDDASIISNNKELSDKFDPDLLPRFPGTNYGPWEHILGMLVKLDPKEGILLEKLRAQRDNR